MKIASLLFLTSLLLPSLPGCGRQPEAVTPVTTIRGERIAPNVPPSQANAPASTSAAAPAQAQADPAPAPGYPLASFEKLSGYSIEISDELLGPVTNNAAAITARTEALIPKPVKALDKQKVSLKGFMLPLKLEEGGLVTEMLILKDQSMCCFGTIPKIHEWVAVKMKDKGVKPFMDQPVTLFGTLHVGEIRENGYLTGLYRMEGERLAVPDGK